MAKQKLRDTTSVLEAVNLITENGTKVWLFDTPPYEVQEETNEIALEVNDMGVPVSKRTIKGTINSKAKIVERDKGFGLYKRWDADHTNYDIIAVTKEQDALKKITMAACNTTNERKFWRKCKNILNPFVEYKFNYEFPCGQEALDKLKETLEDIRDTIHGELMQAVLNPELTTKARLFWDILKTSNQEVFGRQVSVKQDIKVNETKQMELPKIVPPEGWVM